MTVSRSNQTPSPGQPSPGREVYRHEQLLPLIKPSSIAIIGASPTPGAFGERTLANLEAYTGRVYLVNARYERIGERACHPSVLDLPETPDCAVIVVGREIAGKVLLECGQKGVHAAILYASGYAETGTEQGRREQDELTTLSQRFNIRIAGPNCVGLMNFDQGFAMTFAGGLDLRRPARHAVGLVSQSGAVGSAIAQWSRLGYTFSHQLTAGNSCDVDVADYVSYLAQEDACKAIACLFEGLADPQRFLQAGEIARAAGKPLIVHKIATGKSGAAAAMSHTGTIAGSNEAYRALFERIGAIVVDNVEDIAETAAFFAKAPAPKARGAGVVSISGGFCITHADKAELYGVALPQPSPEVAAKLASYLPAFAQPANPCDVTGAAVNNPSSITDCCEAFLADAAYDTVVLTHSYAWDMLTSRLSGVGPAAERHNKIACITWTTGWLHGPGAIEAASDPRVALFRTTERCFRALAAWYVRHDRLQALAQLQASAPPLVPAQARQAAAQALGAEKPGVLSGAASLQIFKAYGIPMAEAVLAGTADEAVAAAQRLGLPVALKIESPDIAHKTEAGGVMLNLGSEAAVREAYAAVMRNAAQHRAEAALQGVMVQPMVRGDVEIMIGARVDPLFGPVVVVALGGVMVELLNDSVMELAPIGPARARAMFDRLKGRALLGAFRGRRPVDLDALADALSRVSALIADHRGRVSELEINPLVCTANGPLGVDALLVTR
ncbi:MAG: acetate--CoA ligase family protein [Burkholderiaceae bacterium]|nr:acetate--CoA ligase family protein [Burkholderiaceae bacterium]